MYYVEVTMEGQNTAVTYTYRRKREAIAHVRRELTQGHISTVYRALDDWDEPWRPAPALTTEESI